MTCRAQFLHVRLWEDVSLSSRLVSIHPMIDPKSVRRQQPHSQAYCPGLNNSHGIAC